MVTVRLCGCDDTTVIDVEVDEQELAVLKRVAALTRGESQFDCMPVMTVGEDEYTEHIASGGR